MDLTGKTILVTGAAGIGVGAGVCQAVDEAGGRLVINDLDADAVEQTVARYGNAVPLVGDISDESIVADLFQQLEAQDIKLDGLVNNAGIGLSKVAHEATPDEFDRLHRVDLRAVWLLSRAFVHHLDKDARPGSIVNISSVHGIQTMNRYAIYAAAKSGVEGLTRGLAIELGDRRIRCNAVAPGYVHSEQGLDLIRTWTDDPEGWVNDLLTRFQTIPDQVEPVDCGWAVVFLLSDFSRRITGQVLRVDAGMTTLVTSKDFS